jgi:hypothetical protein
MRNYILFLLLLALMVTSAFNSEAQTTPERVLVRSWKTGSGKIIEKTKEISLRRNRGKTNIAISGTDARRYVLSLTYFPPTERQLGLWKVEFREKLRSRARSRLSEDLLPSSKPGPGGDYFPREDFVGYLYPRSDFDYVVAGTPWTDGTPFYSIDAVRQIRIEGFSVTLEVIPDETRSVASGKSESRKLRVSFENVSNSNSE